MSSILDLDIIKISILTRFDEIGLKMWPENVHEVFLRFNLVTYFLTGPNSYSDLTKI